MFFRFFTWFKLVRKDLALLFLAWRHPATPRYLKVMLWVALGYLISPVDFLPDYLPGLGMVDDLTIVPAVLYSVARLLPPEVRRDCDARAGKLHKWMPYALAAAALFSLAWLLFLGWGVYALFTK